MNCKVGYVFQYYLQKFKYDENDQITKLSYCHVELEKEWV